MKPISKDTADKLARSLTDETSEALPFLPYLLQDFWALGSEPSVIAALIGKHIPASDETRVLDLACGKGAVAVEVARRLGVRVKGVDLFPEFLRYAAEKARELGVEALCTFAEGDINEVVEFERGYDCAIFTSVGTDVMGGPRETLRKLAAVVRPGGYIVLEDAFIADEAKREEVRYFKDIYITRQQWLALFEEAGLTLVDTASEAGEEVPDSEAGMVAITRRAHELMALHPDKKAIFEGYIRSQQNEYDDLDDSLDSATWILQKS